MIKTSDSFILFLTSIILWSAVNLTIAITICPIDLSMGDCNTDFNRRIEYVMPGHVFGCWLFEDLGGKYEN